MEIPCTSCRSWTWQWCIFFTNCIPVMKCWGQTGLDNPAAMRKLHTHLHTRQYLQLGCPGASGTQPRTFCKLEHSRETGQGSCLLCSHSYISQLTIWDPHLEHFLHPLNHYTKKSKPIKSWIVHVNCHQFLSCLSPIMNNICFSWCDSEWLSVFLFLS